jgi:acyl-CoA dehydrogenase
VINGRKWWTSGAGDPRCEILIFMGKTNPEASRHSQQSMVLVPMNTPGVKRLRLLTVLGYDHAPHGHGELDFIDVRVPMENILLGAGRGFEIAQGRLGPAAYTIACASSGSPNGRLELCAAARSQRVAFGKPLSEQGVTLERIAESRIMIDQARWLVLNAAYMMDTAGNRAAKQEIAMIKVAAPTMACKVIDWAMQVHGGAGVSDDFPLAAAYAAARTIRFADGPDEVHREQIGKLELARYRPRAPAEKIKLGSPHVAATFQILAAACHAFPGGAGHQHLLQRRSIGAPLHAQALPGVLRHGGDLRRICR